MGIKVWGNQHGHGVKVWGKELKLLQKLATSLGITPEEALHEAIRLMIKQWTKEGLDA